VDRDAWNAAYAAAELVWGVEPNRFVAAHLGELPPGRALDVACGEGRNAIWLAQRGWQVTAIDFADAAVEKGRKLASAEGVTIDWLVDDATAWQPAREAFDLVVVSYLQLGPEARHDVWARLAGAVAPGGTLFVIAHDVRNVTDGAGGPRDPTVCYPADDVTRYLDGFDVAFAGEVFRPVAQPDGRARDAIDCLVQATRPT
jgi:SAM-dependent methyltransferase